MKVLPKYVHATPINSVGSNYDSLQKRKRREKQQGKAV